MIQFEQIKLPNGLKVISHYDPSTPLAAVNMLYDVGSKDEDPNHTGLAHLFEHLMFEGSLNIQEFDTVVQQAGGENNAFTSADMTNFYITLPAINIETAFYVESDRMLGLDFSDEKLSIQKKVVVEEFKETVLNQPYGDIWSHMRPLIYTQHPYQWPTIGKHPSHIENVTLELTKAFFAKHYSPSNAILTVAGNVRPDHVFALAQKWFGDLPAGKPYLRNLPVEPMQTSPRKLVLERNVPLNHIYMAFHTCHRMHKDFYSTDILCDVLSYGDSSRLEQALVKEQKLFNDIQAFTMGSLDTGLLAISASLKDGVDFAVAEHAIWQQLNALKECKVPDFEMQKVKNMAEAALVVSENGIVARGFSLAYFELLGNAAFINQQVDAYLSVSSELVQNLAQNIFTPSNASVVEYRAKN